MADTATLQKEPKTSSVSKPRVQSLIDLYQQLKGQRSNFESYWQSLHDYFYIEAQDINRSYYPGTELQADALFDSTTLESADVLASGFMNYLTPPTSRWFALRAKNEKLRNNKKVSAYLEDVSDQVNYTLNKSNFYNQNIASFKGSGVYGTSAMIEEEDVEEDARFYSLPIKQIVIVEDGRGRVSEFFIEFEYTASQAASRWGAEALSDKMKEELQEDRRKENPHPFLLYIAARYRRDFTKFDKKNLPIEAVWIDLDGKRTVEEGGYNEMPAFCHRFDKRPFIVWGFSPAMKALPFARILNACAKTNLRAMMKHTDPPVALPNNAFIMPFTQNPRAVNYYNKDKMKAEDIFAFGNFGNPQIGMTAVEYYSMKVKSIMFNDVFLAFDAITKQMNNPEVAERINEKMMLLGPAVGRYIAEMINPVVIRTIGILARKGKLPPMPDEFILDPEFEIDCISQLAMAQRRSQLNSLVTGLTLVGQMAAVTPDVIDKIDPDKVVDETWGIVGAPMRVLRSDDEVEEIRQAKAAALAQQQQMMLLQQGADVVKKGSEVDANMATTKEKGTAK
jgi:hypothetical protein